MGHKFHQRQGHGSAEADDSQRAPIFLQFLDCIWQITMQNPTAFEFGEDFLLATSEAVESCQFGTFLCNNIREREHSGVLKNTQSAWTFLLSRFGSPNPHYDPNHDVLHVNHQHLRLWARCHLQRVGPECWGNAGPDMFPAVHDEVVNLEHVDTGVATQGKAVLTTLAAEGTSMVGIVAASLNPFSGLMDDSNVEEEPAEMKESDTDGAVSFGVIPSGDGVVA